jgi:hypothetical protein
LWFEKNTRTPKGLLGPEELLSTFTRFFEWTPGGTYEITGLSI